MNYTKDELNPPCGCILNMNCTLHQSASVMYDTLIGIAEGKGAFSRDPLAHAENTIRSMKALALKAIARTVAK